MIAGLADGTNVIYRDLSALFLRPDGTISSALLLDYLHPNTDGYQLMADAVQAPIDELLGLPAPDPTTYGGPILVDVPSDQVAEASDPREALAVLPAAAGLRRPRPEPRVHEQPAPRRVAAARNDDGRHLHGDRPLRAQRQHDVLGDRQARHAAGS
jgi:hypothetical protein